jgi:hypothetical protein
LVPSEAINEEGRGTARRFAEGEKRGLIKKRRNQEAKEEKHMLHNR